MMIEQMRNYFSNYQIDKLDVLFPDLTNLFIIILFFGVVVATTRKNQSDAKNFLHVPHTDQLRGLAIFFVVLGHLWVHVSRTQAHVILSDDAVALFLIISGFGLTISSMREKPRLQEYFSRRIKRVMVPYWIATIVIIFLDYFILGNLLPAGSLLLTFLGVNFKIELLRLDYVRWFVTFILFWYLLFFLNCRTDHRGRFMVSLLVIGFLLLPLNYYIFHFTWYQFLSFPVGCVLAAYHDRLVTIYQNRRRAFLVTSILAILYVLTYKFMMGYEGIKAVVIGKLPNILLTYLSEINSLMLSLGIIFVFGYLVEKGYKSKLLLLLGRYSYEIFLLHGVFLIKYNPVIRDRGIILLILEFSLLISLVVALSFLTYKASRLRYAGKTS